MVKSEQPTSQAIAAWITRCIIVDKIIVDKIIVESEQMKWGLHEVEA